MKKSVFIVPALLLCLAACGNGLDGLNPGGNGGNASLPKGGTKVDITNEDAFKNTVKDLITVAKNTVADLDKITLTAEVPSLKANIDIDNKSTTSDIVYGGYTSENIEKIDVEYKGTVVASVSGLQKARSFSALKAAAETKNLSASVSFDMTEKRTYDETYKAYFAQFGYEDEVKDVDQNVKANFKAENINLGVYLDNSTIYADLSDKQLDKLYTNVVKDNADFLKNLIGIDDDSYDAIFKDTTLDSILEQLGINSRKVKLTVPESATADINKEFPLIPDVSSYLDIEEEDIDYVCEFLGEYTTAISKILTVENYSDGRLGVALDVTKEKIAEVYTTIAGEDIDEEDLQEALAEIPQITLKAAILTDKNKVLDTVKVSFNFKMVDHSEYSSSEKDGETVTYSYSYDDTTTIDMSGSINLDLDLDKDVVLPNDLANYADVEDMLENLIGD